MWQEIITYTILAVTFGSVAYKSIIRPLIRIFSKKNNDIKSGINTVCASCPSSGVSCENCAFYNPRPATYRYKNVKLDSAEVSGKDSKNTHIAEVTALHYTVH